MEECPWYSYSLVFFLWPHRTVIVQEVRQVIRYQILSRHTKVHRVPVLKLLSQFAERGKAIRSVEHVSSFRKTISVTRNRESVTYALSYRKNRLKRISRKTVGKAPVIFGNFSKRTRTLKRFRFVWNHKKSKKQQAISMARLATGHCEHCRLQKTDLLIEVKRRLIFLKERKNK